MARQPTHTVIPHPVYGFTSGEVSPSFYGRTDLTKYDTGAKLVKNFFVGYRGGLISRHGKRFIVELLASDTAHKMFRFKATGNDYVVVFGDENIRFVRDGGYLLEATVAISDLTSGDPLVVTATSHGYSAGDVVFISGATTDLVIAERYFLVGAVTTHTFELLNADGTDFDGTGLSSYGAGGTVARVVTIASPYSADELGDIKMEQRYSAAIFTTLDYQRYRLTYISDTSWTFAAISVSPPISAPTNLALTPSSAGSAGIAFGVTAVVDGKESLLSPYVITESSVDYSATAGSMFIEWDPVEGATEYNVYRSLILPTGTEISLAQELGYIGRAFGSQFTDTNITPDFTKAPPIYYNPFADAYIDYFTITAGGSSYAKTDTVIVTDPDGTGFEGYPIINGSGAIIGVSIVNPGEGYTAPVVTFGTSTGSGATATAATGPATGNNPRTVKIFQQRAVYGGTVNNPMTIDASKPDQIDVFDKSSTVNSGDGYTFALDADEVKPIYHMLALKSGLLIFTSTNVSLLRAEEGKAVTPLNALAEPQAYKGASTTWPIAIDLDVVFAQEKSSSVNAMMYTEYTNSFKMQDVSVLSNHLMGVGKEITRLEWCAEPNKLLYCLRADGRLLTLTYEREQEVFGWAQHSTRGYYRDMVNVLEDNVDTMYFIVERYVRGAWRRFLEVQQPREHEIAEDFWAVDCGLNYTLSQPAATLTLSAITGDAITVTASASVFTSGNIGDIIYAGGGKLELTAYASGTSMTATALRDVTDLVPEDDTRARRFLAGEWEMGTPTDTVTNLHHLEGEFVSILADGDAFLEREVVDGTITLDQEATKIVVGLPYNCDIETLPPAVGAFVAEGRRKDIVGASIRLKDTRGLSYGSSFDAMIDMKDRSDERWNEQIGLRDGSTYIRINSAWSENVTLSLRQSYPLPATVLSLVFDLNIGDD